MQKAIVLLSGGLDSTVNFYKASRDLDLSLALTFDYGQRAAINEIASARFFADALKVPHRVIDLRFIGDLGGSSLTDSKLKIPVDAEVQIRDGERSQMTAHRVWVPNRNGVFLNVAAAVAESRGAEFVVPGFNAEEAATFPDNSQDFIAAANQALAFSTRGRVKVNCFTTEMSKREIYKLGEELGADFDRMWPCYFSGPSWCGRCESCQRFFSARGDA